MHMINIQFAKSEYVFRLANLSYYKRSKFPLILNRSLLRSFESSHNFTTRHKVYKTMPSQFYYRAENVNKTILTFTIDFYLFVNLVQISSKDQKEKVNKRNECSFITT